MSDLGVDHQSDNDRSDDHGDADHDGVDHDGVDRDDAGRGDDEHHAAEEHQATEPSDPAVRVRRGRAGALVVALLGGVLAMGLTLAVAVVLSQARPKTDGSFVLTEPGIFAEPPDTTVAGSDSIPELTLLDVTGQRVDLSVYRGSPMVINVWFTTCPPCSRELRDFATVSAEYEGRVTFVGIDPIDPPAAIEEFATDRGVGYDLLSDSEKQFVNAMGIASYPTTLFVAADGTVVQRRGALDADQLRAEIEALL